MSDAHAGLLSTAQNHWRQGAYDAARGAYREILGQDPDCLEALLQLGHLEREQARFDDAASLHRRAAELSGDAIAFTALGRSLSDSGQAKPAIDAFTSAIRADRGYAPAYLHLGELFGALGELQRAQECFVTAARLDPGDPFARHNLGIGLQLAGQPQQAAGHFRAALELNPRYWRSWQALGDLYRQNGKLNDALACYRQLIELQPDADNQLRLGATEQLLGHFDDAIDAYRKALAISPGNGDAVYNLGTCFQATGKLDEAEALFRDVLATRPGHVSAAAALAGVHDRRGDYAKGLELLLPMIDEAGANPELWVSLARLARHAGKSGDVLPLLERALDAESFNKIDRSRIAFAAGSLRDAAGDYDLAFRHYRVANALKPHSYGRELFERSVDRIIDVFDRPLLERLRVHTSEDARPVFVVGMPRSGSTLIEQILAAHPDVASVGESPRLSRMALTLAGEDQPYPDCIRTVTGEALAAAGTVYLDSLPFGSARVVDKMLSNLVHIGLIAVLFGNARIVHCVRHPLDTLLSCYCNDFVGDQVGFAYDFEDLAHYYRQYRRLMDHWADIGAAPTLDLRYEDIVGDTANAVRSLLDFLGLPWNDRCLTFYENDTVANTASYAQVRRPIYSDSIGRYRAYRQQLSPLADALADYLAEPE